MRVVVIDTNVVIAALRSRRGASFEILRSIGRAWLPLLSVPMLLEYESVGKRESERLGIPLEAVNTLHGAFRQFGIETEIHFRLRPWLSDPDDDFLLELAAAGRAEYIVTHNVRDFRGAERFDVRVITPGGFCR